MSTQIFTEINTANVFIFSKNMDMSDVPNTITHLIFDDEFNEPLNKYTPIPNSVTNITFGDSFKADIGTCLMHLTNVTHIVFKNMPTIDLKKSIPKSVEQMTM